MERTSSRQVEITAKGRRGFEFLQAIGWLGSDGRRGPLQPAGADHWFSARWEEEKARGGEEAAERWACDRAAAEWQAEFGK